MGITALTLGVRIGDDDLHARQQLAGLDQTQRVRSTSLNQRDPVVTECPQIHVNLSAFGRASTLHADRRVNTASERGGHAARVQSQRLEQLAELLRQLDAGSLLGDHDARPHTTQVDVALLEHLDRIAQRLRAQLDHSVRAERVPHAVLR